MLRQVREFSVLRERSVEWFNWHQLHESNSRNFWNHLLGFEISSLRIHSFAYMSQLYKHELLGYRGSSK